MKTPLWAWQLLWQHFSWRNTTRESHLGLSLSLLVSHVEMYRVLRVDWLWECKVGDLCQQRGDWRFVVKTFATDGFQCLLWSSSICCTEARPLGLRKTKFTLSWKRKTHPHSNQTFWSRHHSQIIKNPSLLDQGGLKMSFGLCLWGWE